MFSTMGLDESMRLKESSRNKSLLNFYRLGIAAEKKFLKEHSDLYEGVVVGAHFLAYFQTSTENFLASLGKPFFIDPMNYVFVRPMDLIIRETSGMKGTFEKLLDLYGTEVKNIVEGGRSLIPSDFKTHGSWNTVLIDDFSRNVIEFQRKLLALERITTLDEIMKLAEQPIKRRKPNLLFLVPPYFYAEGRSDEWYDISLKIAKSSNQIKGNLNLHPVVCISKQVFLSPEDIKRIVDDYKQFDGVVLWISDLQDDTDGRSYLKGLVRFVTAFKQIGKPVYSLYGGYFFALLSKLGLTGYSSSICYGTSKHIDSRAAGGWVPLRYYIPTLRIKVSEINARAYYEAHIHELCDCHICFEMKDKIEREGVDKSQASIFVDNFFKKIDIDSSKRHFMESRYKELLEIERTDLNDLINRLMIDYKEHEMLGRDFGKDLDPSHLRRWAESLSELESSHMH